MNHRRSNKNVEKTKGTMGPAAPTEVTGRGDWKTGPIGDHNGRRKRGRRRANKGKYTGVRRVRSGVVSSPGDRDPLQPNWWCQGYGAEGVGQSHLVPGPGHVDARGAIHGVAEGNPGEAPASMARMPGTATWRCALTMGCGRMARVHPVEVAASSCPHDLLHVPHHGDGDRHGPPTPARPGGKRTEKRRLCWRGWTGRSGNESSRGGRGPQGRGAPRLYALSKLLHDKVVTDLEEGGKGPLSGDPRPEVGVAVTEPAENVEDQDTVLHGPAEVAERVCHAFHMRQNSLTERSPWTKVRKLASSRSARASALPRNWPSSARQVPRALGVLRARSWRSREIVPRIQERTMLSRHNHEGVGTAPTVSRRTWSSRA